MLSKPLPEINNTEPIPHGVVRSMKISPSGSMISAIIDYHKESLSVTTAPAELLVWCSGVSSVDSEESENEENFKWICLGSVKLNTGVHNRAIAGKSCIGWTQDDSLILSVPCDASGDMTALYADSDVDNSSAGFVGVPRSNYGCLLSVTHWFESASVHISRGDRKTYVATRSKADGGIDMPGLFLSLPFFSEPAVGMHVVTWKENGVFRDSTSPDSTLRVIFWSGRRLCIFRVSYASTSTSNGRNKASASLIWTDVSLIILLPYTLFLNYFLFFRTPETKDLYSMSRWVGLLAPYKVFSRRNPS